MTGIDLDQMRGRWQQQSARVDAKLNLDIEAVRATLAARSTSAFRKHARWLLAALFGDALALIVLAAFMFQQSHDWVYVLVGLSLALIVLAESITDLHEWRAISALDSSAPLTDVQCKFDDLRTRRLRMTRWILLLSILMWWPLLAATFKGLFGFDLLRRLHWSVAAVNVLVGLLFIPLAAWIARWLSRRYAGSPAFQRMLDEMAGKSFDAASQSVQKRAHFESGLAEDTSQDAIDAHLRLAVWPEAAAAPLTALRRRLLLGICFYAALLIATGLFNASHGGLPQFIIPGVLLNFLWVALMVTGIEQRVLMSRLASAPSLDTARAGLVQIAAWRGAVVRYVLIAAPLLSLALLQLLAKLMVGIDLWTLLGPAFVAMTATVAIVGSVSLYRLQQRTPDTFAPRLVDLLCFGAIRATRAVIAALGEPLR